jgi:hypothetical protein
MAGSRSRMALTVVSAMFVTAGAAGQTPPSPYDVTTYSVVWTVPEAKNAKVVRGVRYAGEGANALVLDLAYPSGGDAAARWPAVVFINGVGGKLNDWEIYRSWARLAAAHGLVGVTAESDPGNPPRAPEGRRRHGLGKPRADRGRRGSREPEVRPPLRRDPLQALAALTLGSWGQS